MKFFIKILILFVIIFLNLNNSYSNNWFTSSGNYNSSKYSTLSQIDKNNVRNLEKAWIYKNGFKPLKEKNSYSNNQATPIFTGTTDNMVYALNSKNGEILWRYKMLYAGSSPPMTYFYKANQYIIVNSSGGRFYGYDNQIFGDQIYAFKLN
jgi:glucose dehydrogenase